MLHTEDLEWLISCVLPPVPLLPQETDTIAAGRGCLFRLAAAVTEKFKMGLSQREHMSSADDSMPYLQFAVRPLEPIFLTTRAVDFMQFDGIRRRWMPSTMPSNAAWKCVNGDDAAEKIRIVPQHLSNMQRFTPCESTSPRSHPSASTYCDMALSVSPCRPYPVKTTAPWRLLLPKLPAGQPSDSPRVCSPYQPN